MASLKEVRGRIASVTSTRKITSAMKLVSASKLRRAQDAITSYLPYQQKLTSILENFISSSTDELTMPLARVREPRRVAIVVISSNSSLCGAFNSNVIKEVEGLIKTTYADFRKEDILIFPIGKKVFEAMKKKDYSVQGNLGYLLDKREYDEISEIADKLIEMFINGEIDRVHLIYNHFKNAAVQQVMNEQYLPMAPEATGKKHVTVDYILEPDKDYVISKLLPKVVRLRLYSSILDSTAAEHGARTTAMQMATDNAQELIQELTLKYNKARQAAITSEIIDIVGGAESLK